MSRLIFSILILCLGGVISAIASADVYQYKDEEGNILYSDKPVPGGKRIKENQPSVAPKTVIKVERKNSNELSKKNEKTDTIPSKSKSEEKKPKPYTAISIISPEHDQAIRSNNGDVEIKISLVPPLQKTFGHKIKIKFDGSELNDVWETADIQLKTLNRGSHTVTAIIIDKAGKKLKQSKQITFHLQRYSRLFGK